MQPILPEAGKMIQYNTTSSFQQTGCQPVSYPQHK